MKRILAMAAALCMILMGTVAQAEPTTLTVRGTGVVSVAADQAQVILGVRESNSDVLVAQSTVNEKINAICTALMAAGVEQKNIGTESLYIYANYDYSTEVEQLTGYTATNTISITVTDISKVGEYIDIAFGAGANTLDNVSFIARETDDAQKEALQLAVQSATEKAGIIAEAAGLEISSVTSISEGSDYYYYGDDAGVKYSNARAEAAADGAPTMVQASSVQVAASVLMEFELK